MRKRKGKNNINNRKKHNKKIVNSKNNFTINIIKNINKNN